MILLAYSECPDQIARMRRLIWAFAVRMCPKIFFFAWRVPYIVETGVGNGLHYLADFQNFAFSTHLRLNKLSPHYILEESNFNFRYVMPCDLNNQETNG